MTKNEIFIKGMESRLKAIEIIAERISLQSQERRDYSDYYQEISYFVHFILQYPEAVNLFDKLIFYNKILRSDPEYSKLLEGINEIIIKISSIFLENEHFDSFDAEMGEESIKNPFYPPITLKVSTLLTNLLTCDIKQKNDLITLTSDLISVLAHIYSRWVGLSHEELPTIKEYIILLDSKINIIRLNEEFEHEFQGAKAASDIMMVYTSINPMFNFKGTTYDWLINDLIKKGKSVFEGGPLLILKNDCYKVFYYLQERITSQLSIESAIDQFATYMSLYFDGEIPATPEKAMQKKFEEFIFMNGYYPITEATVNNGRIDTLAINRQEQYGFLCEYKQVDLGKTEEGPEEIKEKLKNAQIQSSIYFDRLKPYPLLNRHVFLILFTNRKVTFKGSINKKSKDDIVFVIKAVSILNDVPSEIKQDVEIDINDIVICD